MRTTDFTPYAGDHCESSTLVNMLRNRGIQVSEPMVFGLGRGLSYLYWHSKQMPGPFLGGRVKPDHLIRNAAAALGLELDEQETASVRKAEERLIAALDAGEVVGLKLDRYHLDYAREDHHFAAHYLACIGYRDDRFTVAETDGLGVQTTSRAGMSAARSAKGPMSSKNLAFRLAGGTFDEARLADACRSAVRATAQDFLNPPITNLGFKGIAKTGTLMRTWSEKLDDPATDAYRIGKSMEEGGTGGGFFRRLWADFLEEAAEVTGTAEFAAAAVRYRRMAGRWTEFADLLRGAGNGGDPHSAIEQAAGLIGELAAEERDAARDLEEAAT